MNTEYLKEFMTLAETKNFWDASERLYMNQSTLSKHIKTLESELDVELFTRTTRRVELTNYGQTLLPYARAIVRSEFEGTSAIKRIKNIENGLLTIGTIPSMPQYHITQFLAQFQKLYPDTTVRVTEDDPNNLFKYLENENCELIFCREDKASFERNFLMDNFITRIPYMKDRMVALLPNEHPLSNSKSISLLQLKDERFCMIKEGSLMYQMSVDACQNAGFIPEIIFTSHRIDSILDMVTNQNCIALLMDFHIKLPEHAPERINSPWTAVPIAPEISSQISLCYRNDKTLSGTAQKFVDLCKNSLFI